MCLTQVLIIDDDKEISFSIEMSLDDAQYTASSANTFVEGLELIQLQKVPYILVTDYQIGSQLGTELIERALASPQGLMGIVLMSGLPDFKDKVSKQKNLLLEKEIPYFEIDKPFNFNDLDQVLKKISLHFKQKEEQKLEPEANPSSSNAQKAPPLPFTYLYAGQLSKTLREARENLGLEISEVIRALSKWGIFYDDQNYALMEENEKIANKMGPREWYILCQTLHITTDTYHQGYCKQIHMERVRSALSAGEYSFPVTEILKQNMAELCKSDDKKEQKSNCTKY